MAPDLTPASLKYSQDKHLRVVEEPQVLALTDTILDSRGTLGTNLTPLYPFPNQGFIGKQTFNLEPSRWFNKQRLVELGPNDGIQVSMVG
jgi:hypothetical protein